MMNKILPSDNDARLRAAEDLDKNILVEAAAGTGKTTLLIRRIMNLLESRRTSLLRVIAITFTEKAAGELKIKLRNNFEEKLRSGASTEIYRAALREMDWMSVGTIHSFCADLIRQLPVEAGVDPAFIVADEEQERALSDEFWNAWLTKELSKNCDPIKRYLDAGISLQDGRGGLSLRKLFSELVENADTLDKLYVASPPEAAQLIQWLKTAVQDYQRHKLDNGYLGFQDLLIVARNLLRDNYPARQFFKKQFDYLLVDEFQDTDPLQTEIIFLLAENDEADKGAIAPGKLFLVGDPKQSIYRFRRADLDLYGRVKQAFETSGTTEAISVNFRSRDTLLFEVNAIFDPFMTGPIGDRYEPHYISLVPYLNKAPELAVHILTPPRDFASQNYNAAQAARMEAAAIAEHILRLRNENNRSYSDIAVLFRTTTHLDKLMSELRARDIPFETTNAKAFTTRSEVQALRTVLAALDNPADEACVVGALRSPFFACSDEDILMHRLRCGGFNYLEVTTGEGCIAECFTLLRELHESKQNRSVSRLIQELFNRTKGLQVFALKPQGETRIQNLFQLAADARRFQKNSGFSLYRFIRWLDSQDSLSQQTEAEIGEEDAGGVRLMTFHKAKGLEFPVVILYNLIQRKSNFDSIFYNRDTGELNFKTCGLPTENFEAAKKHNEQRSDYERTRLLYVAMTRAKDSLALPLYWSKESNHFAKILKKRYPEINGDIVIPDGSTTLRIETDGFDLNKQRSEGIRLKMETAQSSFVDQAQREKDNWRQEAIAVARALDKTHRFATASAHQAFPDTGLTERAAIPRTSAVSYGSIIHELMEALQLPGGENLDQLIETQVYMGNFSPDLANETKLLFTRALQSPLFKDRISKADRILRELPYAAELNGVFYEGAMDLVFIENGRPVVVDFKTDRVDSGTLTKRAEVYVTQAEIYARSLQKIIGGPLPKVILFFLRPCEMHVFDL